MKLVCCFLLLVFQVTILQAQAPKSFTEQPAPWFKEVKDYLFETNFMARNEFSGFGFSQFADVDGALKVWTPLGQSPEWLAAVNLKSPKIFI